MARLNEPVLATDNLEILRRKFLRQNRDIARINSTQSLRIRALENDCARMLSENLELRGRVMHLESELQGSRAQRVAAHALDIKQKLETQMAEWSAMLSSLGKEPAVQTTSPRATKKAKLDPRLSYSGSPRDRRRTSEELEAAALQEGRMPPLWEDKACPRETLNQDDILALRSQVTEATESPDLGPPPVSRFVDEDMIRVNIPEKLRLTPSAALISNGTSLKPRPQQHFPASASTNMGNKNKNSPDAMTLGHSVPRPVKSASGSQPSATAQSANNGLKRKDREDENKENVKGERTSVLTAPANRDSTDTALTIRDRPVSRPMKELPAVRKVARAKIGTTPPQSAQRKPLGMRNANEAVNSPKKVSRSSVLDEIAKAKAEFKRNEQAKDQAKAKKKEEATLVIQHVSESIPAPAVAPVTSIELEPELPLSAEPHLSSPNSPEPSAPQDEMLDTPPPADISSTGETARGSRRARSAVSYAEPNLRDKMRRPTKQLFDAVAGEGKSMRRISQTKGPDLMSGPLSAVKSDQGNDDEMHTSLPVTVGEAEAASPLAQKTAGPPVHQHSATANTAEKKKRRSALPSHTADGEGLDRGGKSAKSSVRAGDETAAAADDLYTFPTSSPSTPPKISSPEEDSKPAASKQSKSRRHSSAIREDAGSSETQEKKSKGSMSRKRASMMASSRSKTDTAGDSQAEDDSSFGASSADGDASYRDKASRRRRSMMV